MSKKQRDKAFARLQAFLKKIQDGTDAWELANPEIAASADDEAFLTCDVERDFGPDAVPDDARGLWLVQRAMEILQGEACEDETEWDIAQRVDAIESPKLRALVTKAVEILNATGGLTGDPDLAELAEGETREVLFHRTTAANARAILADGFQDGHYLRDRVWTGVLLSSVPLDSNDGAHGDTLLEVSLDVSADGLEEYEWIEAGKPHREWLIPASFLNAHMTARIVDK